MGNNYQALFNSSATIVQLNESVPNFVVKLSDVGMNLTFKYSFHTSPELLEDSGTGSAWINDLTIFIKSDP